MRYAPNRNAKEPKSECDLGSFGKRKDTFWKSGYYG